MQQPVIPEDGCQGGELPTSFDLVAPRADALMESLRATGYSLPDAVSDIIDNSITAGAQHIWLNFHWAGADSWVSILDDGRGMSESGLIDAMRIGFRSPREVREPSDLGRYGLGLKTASISQARSLTVATHVSNQRGVNTRQWDLDHLASTGDWQLLNAPADVATDDVKQLSELDQGTLVIWNKLDRLVGDVGADNERSRRQFHDTLRAVEETRGHDISSLHGTAEPHFDMAQWTGYQTVGPVSRGRGRDTAALIRNAGADRGRDNGHPLCAATSLPSERGETSGGGGAGRLECPTGILCLSKPPAPPAGRLARAGVPEGGALQGWPASKSTCRIPPTMSGTSMFESPAPGRRWRTSTTSGGSRRQPRNRAVTVYRHRGKAIARGIRNNSGFVWQRHVQGEPGIIRGQSKSSAGPGCAHVRLRRHPRDWNRFCD